ncbi:MAG: FAD-dependent oxidoreductase [Candidatus Omnitrophica bacterium]|nr:FAD-dependent oxidoreductase [Candidatus Omnitrophota bacterium]
MSARGGSAPAGNYVIIGNSASGIAAIGAIRECDKKGKITVISDEPYFNYSRPLISYLLGKKVKLEAMPCRGEDFYKNNRVKLILNKKATKLDLKQKTVVLSDKRKIPFDKLLISTGGMPIIPEIKGIDLGGIFTFIKLADVEKIAKYIKDNKVKEAVVIGGGLIGLKATEALTGLKIKVSVVELADRILSATFDKRSSGIIEASLEKVGCKLITNNTVSKIKRKNRKVKQLILKDKKNILTSLVIVAIGVKPNIELVKDTPIKINRGILVNNFMETTLKDIYAAGDCCEAKDSLLNMNRQIAIWPVAMKQGKIAGFNMAGVKKEYQGSFSMNSVELCGIPTVSMGETCPEGKDYQVLEYLQENKSIYKKIVLKENKIVGAIFVGEIERAGIYTGLIKDKIDVSSFKEYLLKEDFGLINLPKELRKHLVEGEVAVI